MLVMVLTEEFDVPDRQYLVSSCTADDLNTLQHVSQDISSSGETVTLMSPFLTGDMLVRNETLDNSERGNCISKPEKECGFVIVLSGNAPDLSASQPKQRQHKGGWPKGKKRKVDIEPLAPKIPHSAYTLFVQRRRAEILRLNVETSVKKSLLKNPTIFAKEWSTLNSLEKQKYSAEAAKDRERFQKELADYLHSDAYELYMKRKRLKQLVGSHSCDLEESSHSSQKPLPKENESVHYCAVCDMKFSSKYHKKCHLIGKIHLDTVTKEFKNEQKAIERLLSKNDTVEFMNDNSSNLTSAPVNTTQYCEDIQLLLKERNEEILTLRNMHKHLADNNEKLKAEAEKFEVQEAELKQDVDACKSYADALQVQLNSLQMVPMLFGMITL